MQVQTFLERAYLRRLCGYQLYVLTFWTLQGRNSTRATGPVTWTLRTRPVTRGPARTCRGLDLGWARGWGGGGVLGLKWKPRGTNCFRVFVYCLLADSLRNFETNHWQSGTELGARSPLRDRLSVTGFEETRFLICKEDTKTQSLPGGRVCQIELGAPFDGRCFSHVPRDCRTSLQQSFCRLKSFAQFSSRIPA